MPTPARRCPIKPLRFTIGVIGMAAAISAGGLGCVLDGQEAERVTVPVTVGKVAGLTDAVTTDLGYDVELTSARVVVLDLQFTTQGEQSRYVTVGAVLLSAASDLLISTAHAHPGHLEGGEVIGELPGRFVVDFTDPGVFIGDATMLTASYDSLNFTFGQGRTEDGLRDDDRLVGHSVVLEGTAEREGTTWPFVALIDQDEGRQLIGGPFQAKVGVDTTGPIELSMRSDDGSTWATLFDGIDFKMLATSGNGSTDSTTDDGVPAVVVSAEDPDTAASHNRIRNALQRHPYYGAVLAD